MKRRIFLQNAAWATLGAASLSALGKPLGVTGAGKVSPRGSAENLILVFLRGAASHVDTFDLKTGAWTPADFEPQDLGGFALPGGLFPALAQQADKFSLLRAIEGDELVHQRAVYMAQTAHAFNPVFSKEQPHLGSLIAYELESQRSPEDILPGFLAINDTSSIHGPGFLSSTYAALRFTAGDGIPGLTHPGGQAWFERRYRGLLDVDAQARNGRSPHGEQVSDFHSFYEAGKRIMYQDDVSDALAVSESDVQRYGDSDVGLGCAVAVQVLAKRRGTRVIQVTHNGWDHHNDIYDRTVNQNLYGMCEELDPALAAMLEDLATLPGKRGGSLLDETLVVVTGEFGRTPGDLTNNRGRDHYRDAWSALVAGGGVITGQAFGATDSQGWAIIDPFWSRGRNIHINDMIATMYSSLGIDWTKEVLDTPSGRVFEYTPKVDGIPGYYSDIVEMFG